MRTRARCFVLFLGLVLGIGCADPAVVQERTRVFEAGLLSSIQDGRTTRQEALLQLGTPAASFEGGRILTFDFILDASGEWRRMGSGPQAELQYGRGRASSLVLVFGPDDRLVRHSLVKDQSLVESAPREAASSPPGQAP